MLILHCSASVLSHTQALYILFESLVHQSCMQRQIYAGRSGRNKDHSFIILQVNINIGKMDFYHVAVIWNNLPSALYGMNGLLNFKSTYKKLYCDFFLLRRVFCFVCAFCCLVICSHIVCICSLPFIH